MQLQLLITRGPNMGKLFQLPQQGTYIVGRDDDCSIQLDDPRVSRHHCNIVVAGSQATLQDTDSSWGTEVNGQKVSAHVLQPGDVIHFCDTEMRFDVVTSPAAATLQPERPVAPPSPAPPPRVPAPTAPAATPTPTPASGAPAPPPPMHANGPPGIDLGIRVSDEPLSPKVARRGRNARGAGQSSRSKLMVVVAVAIAVGGAVVGSQLGGDPADQSAAGKTTTVSDSAKAAMASAETPADSVTAAEPVEIEMVDLIEQVDRSVVRLLVTSPDGQTAAGSGFVVDQTGTVVTNFHVIEGADTATAVFVTEEESRVREVFFTDRKKDIAVLRMDASGDHLVPIKLAAEPPRKGTKVMAFGAPLGLDFTASEGIVSGVRTSAQLAELGVDDHDGTWIQTTAPISPGNSGGPLVNLQGQVVAANTLTLVYGQNLNFAISAEDIRSALQHLWEEPRPLSEILKESQIEDFLAGRSDVRPDVDLGPLDLAAKPEFVTGIPSLEQQIPHPSVLADLRRQLQTKPESAWSTAAKESKNEEFNVTMNRFWRKWLAQSYEQYGDSDSAWHDDLLERLENSNRDAELQTIYDKGCRDPLFLLIFGGHLRHNDECDQSEKVIDEKIAGLKRPHRYPPQVCFYIRIGIANMLSAIPGRESEHTFYRLKSCNDYAHVIADPNLTDLDRRAFADHMQRYVRPIDGQLYSLALAVNRGQAAPDPWLYRILLGLHHVDAAWEARGHSYSAGVRADQWRGFFAHLRRARVMFLQAWKLKPHLPESAIGLIYCMTALPESDGDNPRFWFEQAVRADCTIRPPHSGLANHLLPRWGGTHDAMLGFARECLEVERFDTAIPIRYHLIVGTIARDLDKVRSLLRRPGVVDDYRRILSGYGAQADAADRLRYMQARMVAMHILLDDSTAAAAIPIPHNDPEVRSALVEFGVDRADAERLSP